MLIVTYRNTDRSCSRSRSQFKSLVVKLKAMPKASVFVTVVPVIVVIVWQTVLLLAAMNVQ